MIGFFIDASVTELRKNFLSIAKFFRERQPEFKAVFVSVDTASFVSEELEAKATKQIEDAKFELTHFKSFDAEKVEKYIKEKKPSFLFSNAMNVSNELWNLICNQNSIPIYLYPHGFQIDNLFYKKSEMLGKFIKVMRYTNAIYNISVRLKKTFWPMYKAYMNYILHGADLENTAIDDSQLYPSTIFLYSDYYKGFWQRKYGIKNINHVQIMPYDYMLVPNVMKMPQEKALCYITQTLVEDGRCSKKEFEELLKDFRSLIKKVDKFYVKLHPRADSTIYEEIWGDMKNVIFTREFPNCKCYITHYSSMAYTACLISGNVIIYELAGQPTHDVFKEVASCIVHNIEEATEQTNKLISGEDDSFERRKERISKYSSYTGVSPLEILYKTIF